MPRKGENIYKRKDGRWEGRYIKYHEASGKAKYGYLYASSYNDIKSKLSTAKSNALTPHTIPYGELLDSWMISLKYNTKESTFARYHYLINSHIRPYLGRLTLDQFTNQIIETYLSDLMNCGRKDGKGGLSSKTAADILVLVKRSFVYATDSGYSINFKPTKISIKIKSADMRVFTREEQCVLHSFLITDIDRLKFGVLLSLYTGIRIGELCALKWENVDLNNRIIKIRKTMIRIQNISEQTPKTKLMITDPKSKNSIRDIPIPNVLLQYISDFASQSSEYVLTASADKHIEPRTMQNIFNKYINACGIKKANFHALRHTFATRCVEVGFEIKSLSEILGHSNVNITLNRYVHSSLELKRSNMQKLDTFLMN